MAIDRNASTYDYIQLRDGAIDWDIHLCRDVLDCEEAALPLMALLSRVYGLQRFGEGDDRMRWYGSFQVKSYYEVLCWGGNPSFP